MKGQSSSPVQSSEWRHPIDMAQHESNLRSLQQEMKKKKPKSKVVNLLLDETEDERRRWITVDGPSAHEVVLDYPPLRVQKWVSCNDNCFHNGPSL